MKIKTEDTLEQGRVYEFTYDGKDFVLLQARNRNERRSYKYKAKQLENEVNHVTLRNLRLTNIKRNTRL